MNIRSGKLLCYETVKNRLRYKCGIFGCNGSGHALRPNKYRFHTNVRSCPQRIINDNNQKNSINDKIDMNYSLIKDYKNKSIIVEVFVNKGMHSVCDFGVIGLNAINVVLIKGHKMNGQIKVKRIINSKSFQFSH
jgi:hypothetical protein